MYLQRLRSSKGRDLHLFHVGDSRIYRLHAQAWSSSPKTTGAPVVRRVPSGARPSAPAPVEIDYRSWAAEPGEIYLLATDGAHPPPTPSRADAWPATRRPGRRRAWLASQAPAAATTTPPCSCCASTPCRRAAAPPAAAPGRLLPTAAAAPRGVRGLHHPARGCSRAPAATCIWPRRSTATGRYVIKTPSVELSRGQRLTSDGFVLEEGGSPAGWTAPRHQGLARRPPARPPLCGAGIHRRPDPRPVDGRQPGASLACAHRRAARPRACRPCTGARCCTRICAPRT